MVVIDSHDLKTNGNMFHFCKVVVIDCYGLITNGNNRIIYLKNKKNKGQFAFLSFKDK